jgi:thiol-disulfide isomerase/thioredoxin
MFQKTTLLALILFSGFASATVTVSYIYSPTCSHCEAMKPEWEKAVSRFNQSTEVTFKMFNVLTQEGQEVASALGNIYVPAVYIDLEKVIQGERPDFYEYLSEKICGAINNQHNTCSMGGGGQDPLIYLIPIAIIGALVGYSYKRGWIRYAHK